MFVYYSEFTVMVNSTITVVVSVSLSFVLFISILFADQNQAQLVGLNFRERLTDEEMLRSSLIG